MACRGDIRNELKKQKLNAKYEAKRVKYRGILRNEKATSQEKIEAMKALSKLPRNSAKIRLRNRCAINGSPRGYYRQLGLSRWVIKEYFEKGMIYGMRKEVR